MFKRIIFTIGIALSSAAFAAGEVRYTQSDMEELPTSGNSLVLTSKVYRVTQDRTITGHPGALIVADGATAVLYIPAGVTLTLNGDNAKDPSNSSLDKRGQNVNSSVAGKGAGAGIRVPANAKLIITGEGNLIAKGGNAADGMRGFTMEGYDPPRIDSSEARTGGGGRGGFGGGGAAAAIGGSGGKGGKGGDECDTYRKKYPNYKNFENFTEGNNNRDGNPADSGANGEDMGTVYMLGTVNVTVTGGKPGTKGGTGGAHSGWSKDEKKDDNGNPYKSLNEQTDDWIVGPGGGGGGGGAGVGVSFAIGGGAGGGGGGGGGATGSFTVFDNWDGSKYGYGDFKNCMVGGNGGKGGKGPANIVGVDGTDGERDGAKSVTKKDGDYGHDVTCREGGASGYTGELGKNGTLFISSSVSVETTAKDIEIFSASAIPLSGFECIQYKLSFVIDSYNTEVLQQTLGCAYPSERPKPSRTGYIFRGYFTGKNGMGDMWYDENGKITKQDVVCSKCGDVTLYASWGIEGSSNKIEVKEGDTFEYDGFIDNPNLYQPEKGNLFTVRKGGKLILKNVNVRGSDLGRDSVIKNFGEVFVTNCLFRGNVSPFGAGAVYRDKPGSKAVFYGCTFKENSALEGGVISAEGSSVSVIYSSFFDNRSIIEFPGTDITKVQPSGAVALAMDAAKLNFISCTFVNNPCSQTSDYAKQFAVCNKDKAGKITFRNNIFANASSNSDSKQVAGSFVCGENYNASESIVDINNRCRVEVSDILGGEIQREVNGVNHFARRPLAIARTGGDSDKLYTNESYTEFSTSMSATTSIFLAADQFGQHPIDGWYGAITGNTLQYLINITPEGETLIVPPGRYDPVELSKNITIIGEKGVEDDKLTVAYINGELLEPCLTIKAGGENASISDFSFIYGSGENGGGITAPETYGGYVTNCVFSSCEAMNGGAVAFLNTASQCVFTNCHATVNGGGTYKNKLIDRSRYLACIADEAGGGASEDVKIRASFISKNIAANGGGGNRTEFYNCTFDNNIASASEECQRTVFSSTLIGCVLYGNKLPVKGNFDETTYNNKKATAEYKGEMFYDVQRGDFHLRLRNVDSLTQKHTPVDHSAICVNTADSGTLDLAEKENWLDIEGNPLVSIHPLTGAKYLYGGCYAYAPFKVSGMTVTGTEEWYDNTNAMTSLREAIEAALTDPNYISNEVAVVTFSDKLMPRNGDSEIVLTFDEAQIDVEAFTNRTLVIQGPTDRVVAINGNGNFRAFRVMPKNNLKVENLLFQNCLGSPYGITSQPPNDGGAILNYGNLDVSNCVFVANSTGTQNNQPAGFGGAIATIAVNTNKDNTAKTVIRNSSFARNRARRGGAIFAGQNTRTDIFFSTFGDNVASGSGSDEAAGGAIAMDLTNKTTNSVVTIVNCTLVGNSVPNKPSAGGAIVTRSGLTLLDSIVLGNTSGGITNDVVMAGGAIGNKANARMISTAIGTRTEESNIVDYTDDVLYEVEELENFISTTNAVAAETVLPHIIYPTSSRLQATALLSKYASDELFGYDTRIKSGYTVTTNNEENAHGEIITTYTTNYNFRTLAIRGSTSKLTNEGKTFEVDQLGDSLDGAAIFGSTIKSAEPRIAKGGAGSNGDEPQENPEDPLNGAKVIIIDYLGNINKFATASEAIDAYKPGDTIQAVDDEDYDTLDELFDGIYPKMNDFVNDNDWYDFIDDGSSFALVLNEKAKPIATEIEFDTRASEVVMRTIENIKPGLWYALGRSDSIEGPFVATNWQEAKVGTDGKPYLDDSLTAPKSGESGFYRVIVAPRGPSGEVIR